MRRAYEWLCHMKSAKPDPARILKEHDQHAADADTDNADDESTTQPTLGNSIDWNEFHSPTRYPNSID